jgi:hypothetical protein
MASASPYFTGTTTTPEDFDNPTLVNLTTAGTQDWAIFNGGATGSAGNGTGGYESSSFLNQKAGPGNIPVGDIGAAGGITNEQSSGFVSYSYSDGVATANSSSSGSGGNYPYVSTGANASGESISFQVNFPIGTTAASLTVYASASGAGSGSPYVTGLETQLSASLSTGATASGAALGNGTSLGAGNVSSPSDTGHGVQAVTFSIAGLDPAAPETLTITDTEIGTPAYAGNMGFDMAYLTTVPEPCTAAFLGITAVAMLTRRSRRNACGIQE